VKALVLAAAVAVAVLGGCGSIDAVLDCHGICERYRSCFEGGYDVAACESRCRDGSANNSSYRRQADQCNACIDDRSCAAATFNCTGQCVSVVP